MFLKRHKAAPWLCCLLAACLMALGWQIYIHPPGDSVPSTMRAEESVSSYSTDVTEYTAIADEASSTAPQRVTQPTADTSANAGSSFSLPRFWGLLLFFAGCILALVFVFFFLMDTPLAGPEVDVFLLLLLYYIWQTDPAFPGATPFLISAAGLFLGLAAVRALWSWLRHGFSLDWSAAHRLSALPGRKSVYLGLLILWGLAALGLLIVCWLVQLLGDLSFSARLNSAIAATLLFSAGLAGLCLWRFLRDVDRFSGQIEEILNGSPISVSSGAFAREESQLLTLQEQHREAVKTAVAGERFRVDLIANVSHDLRTPLTAILGYGELLEKESLSPEGQQQLARLNQKAGYMKELVESLFELTKVSSGVAEPKMASIDLIRLLEQTLGLFDDRLSAANLPVRRHYCSDSLLLTTDGARLHQVFANLVGNAAKYALPGTRIHLEVTESEDQCAVRLTNIASYEMDFQPEEILQRFVRGDKARSTQGSGLGLAIAQTYTESLGGHFEIAIDGEQFSATVILPKNDRNL